MNLTITSIISLHSTLFFDVTIIYSY
uniref:Uncharacterized protein n=1 Tax=Arundo donax TaxID=35708 RepID=A0A0A9GWK0_ARUDO